MASWPALAGRTGKHRLCGGNLQLVCLAREARSQVGHRRAWLPEKARLCGRLTSFIECCCQAAPAACSLPVLWCGHCRGIQTGSGRSAARRIVALHRHVIASRFVSLCCLCTTSCPCVLYTRVGLAVGLDKQHVGALAPLLFAQFVGLMWCSRCWWVHMLVSRVQRKPGTHSVPCCCCCIFGKVVVVVGKG